MNEQDSFLATYAVEMHCQGCADSIKTCLGSVAGITNLDFDLAKQMVAIEGSAAPSVILKALQKCGKDAIIRGSGKPNSAAVSILESFAPQDSANPVKGLARIIATGEKSLLVDITLNGLPKGTYYPSFRTSGNISQGAQSTGDLFYEFPPVEVNEPSSSLFAGQSFVRAPLSVPELIGRSFVVSSSPTEILPNAMAGVIARSAGVWENEKQVCACSGKTVWQERKDALDHNIN